MLNSLKGVIQCLERTISPDKKILSESQLLLEKCAQENVGLFISNMSVVLANKRNSTVSRQAAGLQLKNCLTSKDASLKEEYQRRWSNLPEVTRKTVRNRLISSLGTENISPSCAAQCLAYIGAAELLLSETRNPSVGDMLVELSGIASKPANAHRKEAALESIAYICQEINPNILANFHELILHPIFYCMENNKPTGRIRVAAARALLSSLECIHPSFETEEDRDVIMQVICDATQSSTAEEYVIWLEILVKIGSLYYMHLLRYMDSVIFPITLNAIVSTDSNISLQGMEFWCSIAEMEFNLASNSYNTTDVVPSSFFAEKALPNLVPLLMRVLTFWQNGPNDIGDFEDWTPFKGACVCLSLLAQCCSNAIDKITPELSEVSNCIKHSGWRQRNAAIWAISVILQELDPERAFSEIFPLMPFFWECTRDQKSAKVRYAAHMVMSRIFKFCPSLIPSTLNPLFRGLLEHLDDTDYRVAAVVCKCLYSLVKTIYKLTFEKEKAYSLIATTSLSRYNKRIIEKLLKCAASSDEDLKVAAHRALGQVLLNSPDDCYRFVKSTIQTLIGMLRDEAKDSENESYFTCSTLSRVLRKLKANEIQILHELMRCLISILKSGVMNDNVFLVTSTTISFLSLELKVHLPALTTYFKSAVELPDACTSVIGMIGDVFRALGTESLPYLDSFWKTVFDLLTQKDVDIKLRSECLATIMDMTTSVGMHNFQPYIGHTLNQLQCATSITVNKDPEHEELQIPMLQLYSYLFIYFCDQVSESRQNQNQEFISPLNLMEKCLADLSELIVTIVDEDSSDVIILASAELVGIIFEKLGVSRAKKYLECKLNFKWLLNAAAAIDREDTDESSGFGRKFVKALEALNTVEF